MSRTLTAYYDRREDAEAGRQRLLDANIDADNVRIHDSSSEGFSTDSYSSADHDNRGDHSRDPIARRRMTDVRR